MSKKKIGVVLDTNIIHDNSGERYLLDQVSLFLDYSEDLSLAKGGNLKVVLPNIVIEEFLQQKKVKLEDRYGLLLKRYDNLSKYISGAKPESRIEQELNKEREVAAKDIMVLSISPSEGLFRKMIDDAIKKNPPFDKSSEGQKTDAGFKDALIWNTVLEAKEVDSLDSLYFVSGDNVFMENRERLEEEFVNKHQGVAFRIISPKNDGEMRQKALSEIIEREGLIKTDVVKLYDKQKVLGFIQQNAKYDPLLNIDSNIFGSENILDIKYRDFSEGDFAIDSVEKKADDEFVVKVCVDTKKYIAKPKDDKKTSDEILTFRLELAVNKAKNGIFTVGDCSGPIGMYLHPDYSVSSLSESLLRLNKFTRIFYETAIESEMLSMKQIARSLSEGIIESEMLSVQQIMRGISESINLSSMISSAEAINQSLSTNLSSISGLAPNNAMADCLNADSNSENSKNKNGKNKDEKDAKGDKEMNENG